MASITTRFNKHRYAIYLIIAVVLFARATITFHDTIHSNVVDDHCQIAQLQQNNHSVLPATTNTFVPHVIAIAEFTPAPVSLQTTLSVHFQIRAPPVSRV